jgi:hypothetical protein
MQKYRVKVIIVSFFMSAFLNARVDSIESAEELKDKLRRYDLACVHFYEKGDKRSSSFELTRDVSDAFEDAEHREGKRVGFVYFMKVNMARSGFESVSKRYGIGSGNTIALFRYGKKVHSIKVTNSDDLHRADIIDAIQEYFGSDIAKERERKVEEYKVASERAAYESSLYPYYGYPGYYYCGYHGFRHRGSFYCPSYGYPYYYPSSSVGFSIGFGGGYRGYRGHYRGRHRH